MFKKWLRACTLIKVRIIGFFEVKEVKEEGIVLFIIPPYLAR